MESVNVSPRKRFGPGCGFALALALLPAMMGFRSTLYESFYVPTGSMEPTLRIGDRLTATKFAYGWRIPFTRIPVGALKVPSRGDIVVFTRTPSEHKDTLWAQLDIAGLVPSSDYVKRVVAVPGDTVAVVDGEVVLNGTVRPAREEGPYRYVDHACKAMQTRRFSAGLDGVRHVILKASNARKRRPDWGPEKVPRGHVFMLGDNRDRSKDSRSYGFVPVRDIKARAGRVWASLPLCTPGSALPEVRWRRLGTSLN